MRQRTGSVGVLLGAVALMALGGCGESEGVLDQALAEARQAVGTAPDFVVSEVSGPVSVQQGQRIRASVEVCNQGTYGGSTSVDLYLSVDSTMTVPTAPGPSSDIRIASMSTGPLDVGQCRLLSMEGWASVPQEGAYYLGAIVDPDNYRPELLENNNTGLGNRIGVGSRADFIITAVTGPTSARTGQSLAASVTVCNQGTSPDSTFVELYLSANRVISPPPTDHPVGSAATEPLYPGQCQTLAVSGTAHVPTEGAWYLGAAADPSNGRPELIEDNNTWVVNRIGIGSNPDFVVTAVTGPTSARQGQSIPTQVTVCNQGTSGGSTDVALYLSSDTVISVTDSPVGNALTDYLSAGQCQSLSMAGPASVPQEGAYSLGALVDPNGTRPELIEDNNSKAGNRIGIGAKADFVVTAVSGPVSAQRGQPFTASVSVCNHGTSADGAQVELFLSSDSAIVVPTEPNPYADQRVGNAPTGILNPGQCTSLSVSGLAKVSLDGAYYLGAVVDPDNYRLELIENNNSKAGNRIGIGLNPDFFIKSVSGPVSVRQSQYFNTTVVVCNQGTSGASTDVELLLSVDSTITVPTEPSPFADHRIGRMPTGLLNPGQCTSLSLDVRASVPQDGAYYLGAVVDSDNYRPELFEDNNAKAGNRIGVGSLADFIVKSVSGPTSARQGQSLTTSIVVCNQGTNTDSTHVELFLSADTVITRPGSPLTPADSYLGNASTGYLDPGQCQTLAVSGQAQVPMDGAYYLGAFVNPTNRPELIADNNTRVGNRIGIGSNPDFVVTAVTGPTSAQRGQSLSTQVTVCNQGTYAGGTDVALYLSSDAVITLPDSPTPYEDQLVASAPVSTLNPGQCQSLSLVGPASVPQEGAYYLGALVDPNGNRPELIEDNNSKAGSRIGIGAKADFVVTAVSGPVSAQRGQPLTASVSVCNHGTSADSTQVGLLLSSDSLIVVPTEPNPYADQRVGNAPTGVLNPGQCTSLSVSGSAQVPLDGAYYLGAVVDPDTYRLELIEDNNTKAGNRIGIGPNPDFFIKSVSGPVSVKQSQYFNTTVVVCNQGTSGASTDVELLLSVDSTIAVPTEPSPSADHRIGRMPTGSLNPGQCTSLSLEGWASVPDQRAYYLGAIVDSDNSRPELFEDNNAKAGNRIGVGSLADFIVKSVSGPTSAQQGQAITTSIVVCNQGTNTDSTHVELFLSADTVITRPGSPLTPADSYLGNASTGYLDPGQCQTLSVAGSVSVPTDGAYYLGAFVNPMNRPELIEDNNTRVGNRIGVGARADFAVTSVTGPASVLRGQSFTTSVKVCNQGTRRDYTDVALYVSSDAILDVPETPGPYTDQLVASAPVGYVEPGQCRTMSMSGTASVPAEGAYSLAAVVDPNDSRPELIEDNNIGLGNRIGVGSRSDFTVTAVSGPVSAQQGQPITASVSVCNQGTSPGSTEVGLYLSADATLVVPTEHNPYADQRVGNAPTGVLNPGQCISLSVSGSASVPMDGTYYVGAAVDPDDTSLELIEDNNTRAGNRIGVGTRPDFFIKSVTGPTSAQQGQYFSTTVVVCNQGTSGDTTDVELLLSVDSTIAVPTEPSPSADHRIGRMPTGLLNPGQCTSLSLEGRASGPEQGAYYLGAVVDPDNSRTELFEDNNTKAGTVLTLTP